MSIFRTTNVIGVRRFTAAAGVVAALAASVVSSTHAPSASADPCPDVEVVFARGSGEPPGVGGVGTSFVDALRSDIGPKSLGVYPVSYPASTDFSSSDFPQGVIAGIRDASSHLESMAGSCPNTREVLGGYSQGAAVAGFVTSPSVPANVPAAAVPRPMPANVANHVAAVTLFGTPSDQFLQKYGAPTIAIGPLYQPKTLQLCAPGDGICSNGSDPAAHISYGVNGMTGQAADFAANHL